MNSAFLSYGFRPFFLGAAIWACLAMAAWLGVLVGLPAPPSHFGPALWHAHEMIFGYAAAVVAGFALTAVPEWTGRGPVRGAALAGLFVLWLGGRIAVGLSALTGPLVAAVVDCAFLAALATTVGHDIASAGNRRNLVIAGAFALLFGANVAFHAAGPEANAAATALRLGLAVTVALITLVGGRITPAFTGNWLRRRGETALPAPFGGLDGAALAGGVLALGAWVALPGHAATAVLLLIAGGLHAARLARWQGARTRAEPLVWSLHLGYAWVALGLMVLGLAHWLPMLGQEAALHALGAGAIGTMTLAVMTRATLGHTGRTLTAGGATLGAYLLVSLAALVRIGAAFAGAWAAPLVLAAGALWIAAFGIFIARYGPMHLGPSRAPGQSGHG